MEIYLVGGAVRDQLLKQPYHEHDWVVVGASPDELLSQGYQQVGKDFPVFLHPKSKDEYALARTERKSGSGYTGFTCFSDSSVTLEQDLQRRDLTINAIAQDSAGNLIDPYGGQQDLEKRILRHVSPAFVEDPLRVLRVARFAARYAHLGFKIAEETKNLMGDIVSQGEMTQLVSERVWQELDKALGTSNPDVFFSTLRECAALAILMPELDKLFGVPQSPRHHPEIDCGIHSLLSLQQATLLSPDRTLRFAALIHDLGKGLTRADILPKHIGHETTGLKSIKNLCQRLRAPKEYLNLALMTGEFHTHCHRALELKPQTILKLFKACDAFRRAERFEQFLLASEADSRGRSGFEDRLYPQRQYLQHCLKVCNQLDKRPLIEEGLKGKELGEAIHKLQVSAVKQYKKSCLVEQNDKHE